MIVVWCRLWYVAGGRTAERNWDGENETSRKEGEHEHSGVLHHVWLAFLWQPYCASQKWSSSGIIIFVELSLLLSVAVKYEYYIVTSVNMHLVFFFHEWYKPINKMIPGGNICGLYLGSGYFDSHLRTDITCFHFSFYGIWSTRFVPTPLKSCYSPVVLDGSR